MGKKKKDQAPKLTEAENALLTDEEKKVLAEPEGPDEEGKPEAEGKPEETPPEEGGEPEEKKEGEDEGEGVPEKPETEKVSFIIDGKIVEGTVPKGGGRIIIDGDKSQWVVSKDGAGVFPYSKVEERDTKINEQREIIGRLEGKISELEKAPPKPAEKPAQAIDRSKLEAEFYDAEDPGAFIDKVLALGASQREGPAPEAEEKPTTPDEIRAQVQNEMALNQGMAKITQDFPQFNAEDKEKYLGDDLAFVWSIIGLNVMDEKTHGMTKEQKEAWMGDTEHLLGSAREAANRTLAILGAGKPAIDEEALRKEIRAEESKRILGEVEKHLNLSEQDVVTLGGLRDGSGETGASRVAELDSKSPEELEEAMKGMSPEERDRYMESEPT